jgi:hypothetical protein
MKQIIFKNLIARSFACIMLMMCAVSASAQYYMNVYKNDGQKYQFLVSSVDSVCVVLESYNNHEWVDLGLSVKWATCNIGAESPEDYGDYFAWGETTPKYAYDWSVYKYVSDNINNTNITKYCTDSVYGYNGFTDTLTVLELNDDAARANWGGSWRMPTRAEQDELREKCTWTSTTLNGVSGYKVTSKRNGNSIFLPAAGWRYSEYVANDWIGYYWSSSLNSDDPYCAYMLEFGGGEVICSYNSRSNGKPVRAVCP